MKHALRLLCISLISTAAVFAHEVLTHQNIGNVAVAYLQQSAPKRPVLQSLQQLLLIGAVQEDNDPLPGLPFPIIGRYYFHFNPSLNFSIPTVSISGGCTSIEWGLQDNPPCSVTCIVPFKCSVSQVPETNNYRWSQNLTSDDTGAPSPTSIKQFGYVVHLLEDLGSPPHTRNDLHACPLDTLVSIPIGYCDPFELDNNGSTPSMPPLGTSVIDASTFSSPDQFFSSLQGYVSSNYYSDHTTFEPGMPGPVSVANDSQYFYGDCIQAAFLAGTCETVGGLIVHKIAHKGPLYWACVVVHAASGCDTQASIDTTIAQEQFAELGPVIVQHVAAFIKFYAPALNVQFQGSATGTVTSSPGNGINCAADCSALFVNDGNAVTLTANPDPNVMFAGWSQDCSGTTNTVTVTLTSDKTCVANFSPPSVLTVQKGGNGTGTVTSSPVGINCGTGCLIQSAPFNGPVLLTALADPGSSFTGWGGDCSGTALTTTISITTSNMSCIATFSASGMLSVTKPGTGTGTVTSVPPGINCGPTCTAALSGAVQLTATPDLGSTFAGWGQDCSGNTPTTTVNVTGNKTCTATFNSPVAVALNPFGTQTIAQAPGPYNVEVVNGLISPIAAPATITVTLLRQVVSQCSGLLFSSNVIATITQGQMSTTYGFVAGRDPACNTLPITTTFTVTQAAMAPNINLDLSIVPAAQLALSVTR